MIKFEKALESDATKLVEIQKRAFLVDVDVCGEGPLGYNSENYQIQIMNSHIYNKILEGDLIIGGFYVRSLCNGLYEIVRLFIDTVYQGKGIGSKALDFIENMFDDLKILELEASGFRKDNHIFYENRGYIKIGEVKYSDNGYSYKYQKIIQKYNEYQKYKMKKYKD